MTPRSAGTGDPDDPPDGGGGAVGGVPVPGPARAVRGAPVVAHTRNRAYPTRNDRNHPARSAGHTRGAGELERVREEHETLRQLQDRERIAADLHDHVIHELFAIGIGLQGMLGQLTRPDQRIRVGGYIDGLDVAIRSIRNTIFRLPNTPQALPTLRQRLLAVLTEQTTSADLTAQIEFTGPLDQLPGPVRDDIVAVLRETLSNTVRHARASTVQVKITLSDDVLTNDVLTVEVIDNGDGIGQPTRSSGLSNLRRRAEDRGGTLRHDTPAGGGTHLTWTAHTRTPRHPIY